MTKNWPLLARILYVGAIAASFAVGVAAWVIAGLEPDIARSMAVAWLVGLPMLGLAAALLLAAR